MSRWIRNIDTPIDIFLQANRLFAVFLFWPFCCNGGDFVRGVKHMNQQEFEFVMAEIELIIEELADCQFCHKPVHEDNIKLLKQLFRMKLERACALKRAG